MPVALNVGHGSRTTSPGSSSSGFYASGFADSGVCLQVKSDSGGVVAAGSPTEIWQFWVCQLFEN